MVSKTVWQRALLLSLLFHLILVPTLGWAMGRNLFQLPPRQEVIELEVVSLPPEPQPLVQPPVQEKKIVKPQEVVPKQSTPKPVVRQEKPLEKSVAKSTLIAKDKGAVTDKVATPSANNNVQPSRESDIPPNSTGSVSNNPPVNNPPPPRQIVYLPPQLLKKVEPTYPNSTREKGVEGTAVIRVEILENGQVGEVAIKKSSGHEDLDQAAIKAVRKWRFVPAKDKDTGEPVKCFTNFPIVFRLT